MAIDLLKRFGLGVRFSKPAPPAQWRTPATVDRGNLGEACLAIDAQGQGTVLWENAGCLWTMPLGPHSASALMRLPLGEGSTPRILVNSDGRGIALWQIEMAEERQVLGKILGGGDSMAHVVFRTQGQVHHLQAAVDRRGNVLVVWLHEKEGQFEVMAQSFDTRGASWEQEPTSLGPPLVEAVTPHIASTHREHAMVLWEVQDPTFEGLVASHFWPADRIWSDRPVPVVAHATGHHQVVMDDLGNALAIWIHSPYGQRSRLEASYYTVHSGEWSEPEILASANHFSTPRIAMTGDGDALAAWCQGETHGTRLFAKSFAQGKWGVDVQCVDPNHGQVEDFAIALTAEGQAGILSLHPSAKEVGVVARLRQTEWSSPMFLGNPSHSRRAQPQLRICAEGVFAMWMQGEGREKALILVKTC